MFNKIQISFHDKNSQQIGHRRNILIQAIYDKPTANIICMNERLKDFPVRSGAKQGWIKNKRIYLYKRIQMLQAGSLMLF